MAYRLGLDFGTTNTALAAHFDDGSVKMATFSHVEALQTHCRTALFFPEPVERTRHPKSLAGDAALKACIDSAGEGRFMQSLKSFLASHAFGATQIFGVKFTLDDLLDRFVTFLRATVEDQFGGLPERVVCGAPVRFAYAKEDADNAFARERINGALERGGFSNVAFALEPVAAAHEAQATSNAATKVLVADFGGGTSDFALVQLRPQGERLDVIATNGVAVAGDAFDGKIVRHLVSHALGRGTLYNTFGGEPREIPATFFHKLERWHHLSLMNNPTTLRSLRDVQKDALEPDKIEQLIVIIEENLGFHLHAAVGKTKRALSTESVATFRFDTGDDVLEEEVARESFEEWIADDIDEIGGALDELLEETGASANDISQVFMCGGTSFVPKVRETIAARLPAATQQGGQELASIASGLGHIAALDDSERKAVTL